MGLTRVDSWRSLWRNTPLRGGLGRRILLWFLVLSLVPLFLSNSVGYVVSRGIIENQLERYLRALAEIQAQQVATEVERHQLFLDGIAVSGRPLFRTVPAAASAVQAGRLQESSVMTLGAHLDHELEELTSLTELFILDTTGTVIAATDANRLGQDWSLSKLFRRGRVEHFFEADWDKRNGDVVPLYRLAVPIRDERGGVRGVLGGSVGFEALRTFLRHPEHAVIDVHAFIVDHLGFPVFISHPHIPVDYRQRFPSPLVDQPPGSLARYVNYEGVDVVGTSTAVSGVAWLYVSEVSVASALGQLRGLALLAATLESVFALLLVAVVWTVARSIVAPLRRLVVAAERIRTGYLDVTVGIERDDELGDLGRTFNQMSSELQSSALEIQELHEKELRRAAQLASVGELASGIAHEIKNPLVGVASGVDLLSKRVGEDPKAAALLGQMHSQIRRIESALQDLLSYASPKEPLLTWTEPRQLVEKLVDLVRPQADAAGVRIEERHAEALPTIRVDPELLTQALVNLALNAIQAMEPGGVLRISVEVIDGNVGIVHARHSGGGAGGAGEMSTRPVIAVVDDEELFRTWLSEHLGAAGYTVIEAATGREALRLATEQNPALMLLDLRLPDADGLELVTRLHEIDRDLVVVIVTAYGEVQTAVRAVKAGAYHFLEKPVDLDDLLITMEKGLEAQSLRREIAVLREQHRWQFANVEFVGRSLAVRQLAETVEKVARTESATVLLQGESGTGKDLVARAVHAHSSRKDKPFLEINCTTLPEQLVEAELFGHERGAYTDARERKKGLAELADGGTLLLDEIGDMPLGAQVKLLRFLEDSRFKRLGGTTDITVNVRVIAATNQNLDRAIEEGKFRSDLYYRLKVVDLYIPPLRERSEDCAPLALYFIEQLARDLKREAPRLTSDALRVLETYSWPGNIRELRNVLERALIMEDTQEIRPEHLPMEIRGFARPVDGRDEIVQLPAEGLRMEDIERSVIEQALTRTAGNVAGAARLLGLSRDTLRYRMKKYDLANSYWRSM